MAFAIHPLLWAAILLGGNACVVCPSAVLLVAILPGGHIHQCGMANSKCRVRILLAGYAALLGWIAWLAGLPASQLWAGLLLGGQECCWERQRGMVGSGLDHYYFK